MHDCLKFFPWAKTKTKSGHVETPLQVQGGSQGRIPGGRGTAYNGLLVGNLRAEVYEG